MGYIIYSPTAGGEAYWDSSDGWTFRLEDATRYESASQAVEAIRKLRARGHRVGGYRDLKGSARQ